MPDLIEPPSQESLLSLCLSSFRGEGISDESDCEIQGLRSVRSMSRSMGSLGDGLFFNDSMGSPRRSIFAARDQNSDAASSDSTHVDEFVDLASSLHEEFQSISLKRTSETASLSVDGSFNELLMKIDLEESTTDEFILDCLPRVLVLIRQAFDQPLDEYEASQKLFLELYDACGLDRCDVDHSVLVPINNKLIVAFLLVHSSSIVPKIISEFKASNPPGYIDLVAGDKFLLTARVPLKYPYNASLPRVVENLLRKL